MGEHFAICNAYIGEYKVGARENDVMVEVEVFSVRKPAMLMFNIKCIC